MFKHLVPVLLHAHDAVPHHQGAGAPPRARRHDALPQPIVVNRTLVVKTHSWYMGSNVEGKPRRLLSYIGGVGTYRTICDAVAGGDFGEDFLITHFFNPVRYMRLLELVPGPHTEDARAIDARRAWRKQAARRGPPCWCWRS